MKRNDEAGSGEGISRRTFVKWGAATGLLAVGPCVVAQERRQAAQLGEAAPPQGATAGGVATPGAEAVGAAAAALVVRPARIDPNFRQPTEGSLGEWYRVMLANIPNPRLTEIARSGGTYFYGRMLANEGAVPLLLAFRASGDPRLLAEVDRVMQICRDQLQEIDGFTAWPSRPQESVYHVMNALLAHGFIAHYAYLLKENAEHPLMQPSHGERTYGERFAWWLSYLREHHEARFRRHTGVAEGYPIMSNFLTHPWTQNIVYHHFMEKAVRGTKYAGDAAAYAAGKQILVDKFRGTRMFNEVEETNSLRTAADIGSHGQRYAWVWSHFTGDWKGDQPWHAAAQLWRYSRNTTRALLELAADGDPILGAQSMPEVARTVARFLMYRPTSELHIQPPGSKWHEAWANDINGHDTQMNTVDRYGTRYDGTPAMIPRSRDFSFGDMPPGREPLHQLCASPYTCAAAFADDTDVVNGETDRQRILAQSEIAHRERPATVSIPAGVVWSLRWAGVQERA